MAQAQRAFIFDMDGTIVDNMDFHTQSWVKFFERRGIDIDADAFFRSTAGRQGKEIMRSHLGDHLDDDEVAVLNHEKEAVYRELYEPHRKAIAGFEAFCQAAKREGIALAVATSAPVANITFVLDGLHLRHLFDAVVGAADVECGKPHPDVFLKAAGKAGAQPHDCIVFEDAPLGVEAARNAGMRCVVLSTTLPADAFGGFDNVIRIAPDYTELAADDLFAA